MIHRRPILAAAVLGAALAGPSAADAAVVEIGKVDTDPKPNCPSNCIVASRTTGYQAKVGATRGLMTVPQDGRLVAWTATLGKPGTKQTAYFDEKLGGEATAQITVLRPGRKLRARVMGEGAAVKLAPYFGTTAQFALPRSIPVKKGWVVALTIPTWAPVLGDGLPGDTSWRASRPRGGCDDTGRQTAQAQANQLTQYWCLYRTARLSYSATMVTDPAPAEAAPATTARAR